VFVVADEIQSGLRRCGPRSVALAHDLPVDAVLFGKALGGGVVPVSAAVCTERLFEPLTADPIRHSATFAGNPLSCAAVPATLAVVEELAPRGPVLAALMRDGLDRLHRAHPAVRAVRGRGLLWALELASVTACERLVVALARAGLIVSPCVGRPSTLRLLPPLTAGDADVAEALDLVDAALSALPPDEPSGAR
jgi:putrescine aminotransferase